MGRLGPFEENTIVVGDCLDIMAQMPDGCVDLVVTDPPYGKQALHLWLPVGKEAQRILKEGGSLVALSGQYYLPQVFAALVESGMDYYWTCKLDHVQFQWFFPRQMMITWRPMLWFAKGTPNRDGMMQDRMLGIGMDKSLHPWGQSEDWVLYWLHNLTGPEDLIFDPFMGSGTTAVVADRLGRKFFGCDINPDYVEMALKRLEKDRAGRQLELC